VYAHTLARAKTHKNKPLISYIPFVVFIEKNDERGFFYSQKQIQIDIVSMDFYRRWDCVAPVMGGEWKIEKPTFSAEKICTVSGVDIRAVLYAAVDVAVNGGNGELNIYILFLIETKYESKKFFL
jgi:hypothetical protein